MHPHQSTLQPLLLHIHGRPSAITKYVTTLLPQQSIGCTLHGIMAQDDWKSLKSEGKPGFLSTLAMVMWLGGFHVNTVVTLVSLWNLPSAWAFTLLATWIALMFIPTRYPSPVGEPISRFICKHASAYFPIKVVIEDEKAFDLTRSYVIAAEPHSVLPIGIIVLTPQSGFLPITNLRALASTAVPPTAQEVLCTIQLSPSWRLLEHRYVDYKVFWTPVVRHVWSWLGLAPVSKKSFTDLLAKGISCVIVPGGVQECIYMEPDREVVYLKNRYGFVRIAMEAGAPIVPTFCFGQTNIYRWWKPSGVWYTQASRALGFTPLVFWGRFGGPIPFQKPMYYAVGTPIEVTKVINPSRDKVAVVHGQFIKAVEELFERHKAAAGFKDTELLVY